MDPPGSYRVNPSAWGHLNPSSYCDVGRFLYRVFDLYLTEFIFVVRIHPTEFPFKSLRVSDNKRFVSCEPSVMK